MGLRNSFDIDTMPTASTAQILGNYECFEPNANQYLANGRWLVNIWS